MSEISTPQQVINEQELWQNALVQIELDTSEASFRTWFRNTAIVRRDSGEVFLAVPSKMVRDWLKQKHNKLILKTLRSIDPTVRSVNYIIQRVPTKQQVTQKRIPVQPQETLGIGELYIDKRDNLNPRYTFENFVVGPFNELAHAAVQAVLQNPGLTYNPLFIYGRTGHGKTHLIQAVGNHLKTTSPTRKVFYVTSERFMSDYINAVRTGKAEMFKNQYRQYDVLILDDVQFIARSEKTQEELFHLFNTLHDNNKQIVFSSDQHPAQMIGFEERLRGRFVAGMIAEIPEPDFESRVAILEKKTNQYGISIDKESIHYIAENVRGSIREIEGVLNTIMCKSQISGSVPNKQEIEMIIKHTIRPQKGVSVEEVVRKISQYYEVDERSIYEKTRKKEIVKPRQIVMYILRNEFNVSFPTIGDKLGGRDHTTVIHSCEKIKEQLKDDVVLGSEVEQIRRIVN